MSSSSSESSKSSNSSSSESSWSSGSLFSSSSSSSDSGSSSSVFDQEYELVDVDIRAGDIVIIDDYVSDMNPVSDIPNRLVVNDVADAGGGQHHHLEVYCIYRRGID